MNRLIAISLNPNIQNTDIKRVIFALPKFFLGKLQDRVTYFEELFSNRFGQDYHAISFWTGRAAWWAILSCLDLEKGDEVLVPAFTCVAVVNPIKWLGLKPIFVDVDDGFHLDLHDAHNKLTQRTKVLLAQHTFGQPCNMQAYQAFAQEHDLMLIEDCAHALGGTYDGNELGTFGVAAFFSLGRDKCVSSGTGGIAITKDQLLAKRLRDLQFRLPTPSTWDAMRYLIYVIAIELLYVLYAVHSILGKSLHRLLLSSGLIKTANSVLEKKGDYDPSVLQQWHPVLAWLAERQIWAVSEFNLHRSQLANLYKEQLFDTTYTLSAIDPGGTCLRYPILTQSPEELRMYTSREHIILGDWYDQPIGPRQVNMAQIGYEEGSCPNAERLSRMVVNLPTSPRTSIEDAKQVIRLLRNAQVVRADA